MTEFRAPPPAVFVNASGVEVANREMTSAAVSDAMIFLFSCMNAFRLASFELLYVFRPPPFDLFCVFHCFLADPFEPFCFLAGDGGLGAFAATSSSIDTCNTVLGSSTLVPRGPLADRVRGGVMKPNDTTKRQDPNRTVNRKLIATTFWSSGRYGFLRPRCDGCCDRLQSLTPERHKTKISDFKERASHELYKVMDGGRTA